MHVSVDVVQRCVGMCVCVCGRSSACARAISLKKGDWEKGVVNGGKNQQKKNNIEYTATVHCRVWDSVQTAKAHFSNGVLSLAFGIARVSLYCTELLQCLEFFLFFL